MHININNKFLSSDYYKVKCVVGKRGIGKKLKEGDKITPKGKYKVKFILYRKDRVSYLASKIPKYVIKKNMGWCDDPESKDYNKLIRFPFSYSAEKLYREDNIYDIILVLNYNLNPIVKNKGSAIFIHIATKNYKFTKGCIAINKRDLRKIIKQINQRTIIKIN
ncbi:L,D-transpeptidase family protein [Candidatus Pelagibacter bacterium]|nr:L,D-transpeptidase family protein [Candidatus Pelagibacter bacterium]